MTGQPPGGDAANSSRTDRYDSGRATGANRISRTHVALVIGRGETPAWFTVPDAWCTSSSQSAVLSFDPAMEG
jgi:hypothetical protein